MTKKRAPNGLGTAGRSLWHDIAGSGAYTLRPDEYRVLEQAARMADTITRLETALVNSPDVVKGSMGQPIPNGLFSELRYSREAYAKLLRQLDIPDTEEREAERITARSDQMRGVANIRWGNRGAA